MGNVKIDWQFVLCDDMFLLAPACVIKSVVSFRVGGSGVGTWETYVYVRTYRTPGYLGPGLYLFLKRMAISETISGYIKYDRKRKQLST